MAPQINQRGAICAGLLYPGQSGPWTNEPEQCAFACSDQTPQTHDFKSRCEYLETVRSDGGGVVVFRFRYGQGFLNHIGSVGRRPTR